jgi:hypothetical protein
VISSLESNDPHYVHHLDSPTIVLDAPLLSWDNYDTWIISMALRAKINWVLWMAPWWSQLHLMISLNGRGGMILYVHGFPILLQVRFVAVFYMLTLAWRFGWTFLSDSPNPMFHKFISWSSQFLLLKKRTCLFLHILQSSSHYGMSSILL